MFKSTSIFMQHPFVVADKVKQMEVINAWKEWYKEGLEMTKRTMEELEESFKWEEEDKRAIIEEYKEEASMMTNSELADAIINSVPVTEQDRTFLDWVYIEAAERLPEDEQIQE